MLYASGAQGELGQKTFAPRSPLPAIATIWHQAAPAALAFWARVVADDRISREFKAIAQAAEATIQGMLVRFGSRDGSGTAQGER